MLLGLCIVGRVCEYYGSVKALHTLSVCVLCCGGHEVPRFLYYGVLRVGIRGDVCATPSATHRNGFASI